MNARLALAVVLAGSPFAAPAADRPESADLLQTGRIADALPLLTRSVATADGAALCAAAETLVAAHRALGDPFRARAVLERTVGDASPVPCATAVALARLQAADGDLDAARATLARVDGANAEAGALALAHLESARLDWLADRRDAAVAAIGATLDTLERTVRSPSHAVALLRLSALLDGAPPLRSPGVLQRVHAAALAGLAAHERAAPETAARYLIAATRTYRLAGRTTAALNAARRAAVAAQRAAPADLEYLALAELADALVANGDGAAAERAFDAALAAFDRARLTVVADALLEPTGVRGYAGRAFLGYASLLLRDAAAGDEARRWRALDVMERYKRAELQEFFLNACPVASRSDDAQALARRLPAGVLLVYPIVLPDRVEVLAWDGGTLAQHTVADAARIDRQVRALRVALTDADAARHRPLAQALYGALLQPIAALERAQRLVVVPDGALRLIPWPALHDGTRYAIERLPVTSAPLLVAAAARSRDAAHARLLVAGLTEAVQGFPALPGVAREIEGLSGTLGAARTTVFADRAFDAAAVEAGVAAQAPAFVHLATHGEIGRRADQSYLLTYADRVRLDDLDRMLRAAAGAPLELVALSACQTAAGDDRAALGLGGLALQAGADRVLATLWYVSDAATAELMQGFYRRLANDGVPAPAALRDAQLALLRTERYAHPQYWAPYVLVERVGAR
jgi:CHAT domain-containing protein